MCLHQVLRSLSPVALEDTVLGQYTAAGDQKGYLDDETVPKGSKTPTFATCVMRIHNERCAGQPCIAPPLHVFQACYSISLLQCQCVMGVCVPALLGAACTSIVHISARRRRFF